MPPKVDGDVPPPAAAASGKPPMVFSNAQFERLMKSFDAPSQRAAVAAEAAQAAAATMQQALDLIRGMQDRADGAVQGQGTPARPPTGDRISKRMPLFWEHQPEVWFSVLEGHFADAQVTADAACYRILVPLLSSKAVTQVKRILLAPPADAYARCKADLLAHFQRDQLDMLRELREVRTMGDRDAVEFLNYLRSLSPEHQDCPLIRLIFLDALPPAAKHAMVGMRDLDEMAAKAQEVLRLDPSSPSSPAPAEVSSPAVALVSDRPRRASRSPGPQRSRERWRSPARRSSSPAPDLCALHFKYGQEAHKCLSPDQCNWERVSGSRQASGNSKAFRPRRLHQLCFRISFHCG